MDGEDLIICLAVWTLYKRWVPLTCDDLLAISIASRNELRFKTLLGAIRVDFGRFWEAKPEAKIEFWEVFLRCVFRMRFGVDFGRIFGDSKPEKSIKTMVFPMVFAIFHKIDVFEKNPKKFRFWNRFGRPKQRKIEKKSC